MPEGKEGAAAQNGGENQSQQNSTQQNTAPAVDAAALQAKLDAANAQIGKLQEKAKTLDQIDSRYRNDPSFKQNFDSAWAAQKEAERAQNAVDSSANPTEAQLTRLNQALENLNTKVANLESSNAEGASNAVKYRNNLQYEAAFADLADTKGYTPGTKAYQRLQDNVIAEGLKLAEKYGLLAENGLPDPMRQFKPEMIKEAFENVMADYEESGFNDGWNRRKTVLAEQKRVATPNPTDKFFQKDNLKTGAGRANAVKQAFESKFGRVGPDLLKKLHS